MAIPLQVVSLYDGQVFMWSYCLLNFGTDFLIGNMVFVWSDCLLDLGTDFLVFNNGLYMKCVISCGSTSFP